MRGVGIFVMKCHGGGGGQKMVKFALHNFCKDAPGADGGLADNSMSLSRLLL